MNECREHKQCVDERLSSAKHGNIEAPELDGLLVNIRHGVYGRQFIGDVKCEIDTQAEVHQAADFFAAFLFDAMACSYCMIRNSGLIFSASADMNFQQNFQTRRKLKPTAYFNYASASTNSSRRRTVVVLARGW